ncbi:MAG: tetratricopeptide repeat protein [Phycisphaera sp.]|nr:tetratricopeptide repeat protein [Phycisphaera sp.]
MVGGDFRVYVFEGGLEPIYLRRVKRVFGLFKKNESDGDSKQDKPQEEMSEEERAEFERKQELAKQREIKKAKRFFEFGEDVAAKSNYDYSIECYINGLRLDPENMKQHEALRAVALKRKQKGGKGRPPKAPTKTPVERAMKAELLWSYDPENASLAMAMMDEAVKAELGELAYWVGDFVIDANRKSKSPNKHIYLRLTDLFSAVGAWDKAVESCRLALSLDPMNMPLQKKLKDCQAELAVHQGRFESEGGFRESIRDSSAQRAMEQETQVARTEAAQNEMIKRVKSEFEADRENVDVLQKYVRLLLQKDSEDGEDEAMGLLNEAFIKQKQYRLKMQIGDIKIKQYTRRGRVLRAKRAKAEGEEREVINTELQQLKKEQLEFELVEYAERVKNYPTDMSLKFKLGVRQLEAGNADQAISLFQEAQSDPKHRAQALRFLGEAFAQKKWLDEAVDTFHRAIEVHPFNDDALAMELRYSLMKVLETKAREGVDIDAAQEATRLASQIAQADINYKDIRECVNRLRGLVDEMKKGASGV